ncbi:MAG: NYN domain-containing protein [Spirochaetes bacterium]|jgi:uncharacterized protein (TIGR00288 family)|nr:NYN domain-containing protein [Spirochaetota bacterium]
MTEEESSVAILWDAENVRPKNLKSLVDAVGEFTRKFGRLSVAYAFADWRRRGVEGADELFSRASFQLVHIPKGRKNSADISMVTSGMELLFLYPHIATYILVTGDADFRPLIVSIRRRGARIVIICDAQSASEDLLELADDYKDYRDLLSEDDAEQESSEKDETPVTREAAFQQLAEAVSVLRERGKTPSLGPTKIRLSLLNEDFNERKLGYRSWKAFVLDAQKNGYVTISSRESDLVLDVPKGPRAGEDSLSEPLASFLTAVSRAREHRSEEEVPFGSVGSVLKELNVDYGKYGYRSFKGLVRAAEKRGLVESVNRGLEWCVRLTNEGSNHLR